MKFFKPEDFENGYGHYQKEAHQQMADFANAKLERECVRLKGEDHGFMSDVLVLPIKSIEVCKHPSEKVNAEYMGLTLTGDFVCECGAKVKPASYEAVK
jgi:hypothetical protein